MDPNGNPRSDAVCVMPTPHWTHLALRALLDSGLPQIRTTSGFTQSSGTSIFDEDRDPPAVHVKHCVETASVMSAVQQRVGEAPAWPVAHDLDRVAIPPVDHLLILAQLSKILGTEPGLNAILQPRSMLIIHGEIDGIAFKWAFERAFAPQLRLVDSSSRFYGENKLVTVDLTNCKSSPNREWRDILSTRNPVLVRALPGEDVPSSVVLTGARQISLPKHDCEIARWMMCVIFARDDTAELDQAIARLPDDDLLGAVAVDDFIAAFRQATPLSVALTLESFRSMIVEDDSPKLADLAGYGAAATTVMSVVEELSAWSRGEIPWSDVPRGVILHGPPGVGKTALVRAVARHTSVNFVSASHAGWQRLGHQGNMLEGMNVTFREAAAKSPCILFIDEIDSFVQRSPRNTGNSSYDRQVVNGLLEQLDGITDREGVIVIGACNDIAAVDLAVRRAGRFDHEIRVGLPTLEDLPSILRQHLREDLVDADLTKFATHAYGKSGADCAAAVRNARSYARREKRSLEARDLMRALGAYQGDFSAEKMLTIACHEAGHAIVAAALELGTPLSLRINAEGGLCITDTTRKIETREDFHQFRMYDLAGRAAERLIFSKLTIGSGGTDDSDIAIATQRLIDEELSLGLGESGPIYHGRARTLTMRDVPPEIRQSFRKRLQNAEDAAFDILQRNQDLLREIMARLADNAVLGGKELSKFLGRVAK